MLGSGRHQVDRRHRCWGSGRPGRRRPAGPRRNGIVDFWCRGGPGRPRSQPDPDQAAFSSLGSGRPRAAQKPAGPGPNGIFDVGCLGGPGRPRSAGPRPSDIFDLVGVGGPRAAQKPSGPRPKDSFDFGIAWAAPGSPGQPGTDEMTSPTFSGVGGPGRPRSQPGTDQPTSSILGARAATRTQASRTQTKRHLRFWESGRPTAAQKPARPRPNESFELGGLGGPGRLRASRALTKCHHRFWRSGRRRTAQKPAGP